MRTGIKVAIGVSVGLAVLVAAAFVALRHFSRKAFDVQGEAWREGRRFGESKGLSKRACANAALGRGDKCGLNATCRFRAAAFAEGCLSQAPMDDPLCTSVPPVDDAARHAAWQDSRCPAGSSPACTSIARAVGEHCDRVTKMR